MVADEAINSTQVARSTFLRSGRAPLALTHILKINILIKVQAVRPSGVTPRPRRPKTKKGSPCSETPPLKNESVRSEHGKPFARLLKAEKRTALKNLTVAKNYDCRFRLSLVRVLAFYD